MWQTFFGSSIQALDILAKEADCPPLSVITSYQEPSLPLHIEAKPMVPMKEDSPTSYDLLDELESLLGKGGECKDELLEQADLEMELQIDLDGIQDFLDSQHQGDLIGGSACKLGEKLGAIIDRSSDPLGPGNLNLPADDDNPIVSATSFSFQRVHNDPPYPSSKDKESSWKLSAGGDNAPLQRFSGRRNISPSVTIILQNLEFCI